MRDKTLEHSLFLLRYAAQAKKDVVKKLEKMKGDIIADIVAAKAAQSRKGASTAVGAVAKTTANYYSEISTDSTNIISKIGRVEAKRMAAISADIFDDAGEIISDAKLNKLASTMMFMGSTASQWWDKQRADTTFKLAGAIMSGLVDGGVPGIISKLSGGPIKNGILDISERNAESLISTFVSSSANKARIEIIKDNQEKYIGMRQISTLDISTTDICIAYADAEWDLDENPINGTTLPFDGGPPRHYNCRAVIEPMLAGGLDKPPPDDRIDKFLERKGEEFQDEMLGVGRAQMWRDGTITLNQLLDLRGNPITLKELEEKYKYK